MAKSSATKFLNKSFIKKTINGVFLALMAFIIFAGGAYVNEMGVGQVADAPSEPFVWVDGGEGMTASAVEAEEAWRQEGEDALLRLE